MNRFKFSVILILSSLFLFSVACQEDSSILGPENESVSVADQLGKKIKTETYSVSKLIRAEEGGKIKLKTTLKDLTLGKKIKVSAEIKFPPNLLTEDTEVTLSIDPSNGMMSFSPQMSFPEGEFAPLKISFNGAKLKKMKIKKEEIKFVYFDELGSANYLDDNKIKVKKGSLGVKKVELPYFSTFGFTFFEIPEDEDPVLLPTRFGFSR